MDDSDSSEKNDQLRDAITMLAMANVRLCNIALAADKLVEAVKHGTGRRVELALEDYLIIRNGS